MGSSRGLARHLEGWQPGLVAVLIALIGTLLAVPLEVEPREVPPPSIDEAALAGTLARDRALAKSLAEALAREVSGETPSSELFDLRALGTAYREYGKVDASPDATEVVAARRKLAVAAKGARPLGDEKLLGLRAYEKELFIREARDWEKTGEESEELEALGGPFIAMARRNGWVDGKRLLLSDLVLGVLFKRRWSELTGLTEGAFAPTIDETRAHYRFLLAHPSPFAASGSDSPDIDCRLLDQWRMRKVEELAQRDPEYPYKLARGVLLYRLGQPLAAAQAFTDFLDASPDGKWVLRARNYRAAAIAKSAAEP